MRPVFQIGMAALFALVTACGNTADGAKQDAENASDKAGEMAADAGNAMASAAETADIKTAFMADSLVSAFAINIDTNKDAKTVTLSGTVDLAAQRERAEAIAKEKAPGFSVINNLEIKK